MKLDGRVWGLSLGLSSLAFLVLMWSAWQDQALGQPGPSPEKTCVVVVAAPEKALAPGEVMPPRPDLSWLSGREASMAQRSSAEVSPGVYHWRLVLKGKACDTASSQSGFLSEAKDYTVSTVPSASGVLVVTVESKDCKPPVLNAVMPPVPSHMGEAVDAGSLPDVKPVYPDAKVYRCPKKLSEVKDADTVISAEASWPGGFSGVALEEKDVGGVSP